MLSYQLDFPLGTIFANPVTYNIYIIIYYKYIQYIYIYIYIHNIIYIYNIYTICNSYNTGKSALPDIYARCPRASAYISGKARVPVL